MKKRILLFLLSFVLFTTVFASCGRGEEVRWIELELSGNKNFIALNQEDIQRELFKKYHVCSKENEYAELMLEFERRLDTIGTHYDEEKTSESIGSVKDYIYAQLLLRCKAGAEETGISLREYILQSGLVLPCKYDTPGMSDDHLLSMAVFEISREWYRINYLARLWELEPDEDITRQYLSEGYPAEEAEYRALKQSVFAYVIDRAGVRYSRFPFSLHNFSRMVWHHISYNGDLFHEIYVVGEDGYAAVYTGLTGTRGQISPDSVGECIWGNRGTCAVFRVYGANDWTYLIESVGNGDLMMARFNRWVTADSEDYDAFVAIYGTEPKLHP